MSGINAIPKNTNTEGIDGTDTVDGIQEDTTPASEIPSPPAPPPPPSAPPPPPAAPAPPPPPAAPGKPIAPSSPPADGKDRNALLSSISAFKKGGLKKAETVDKSAPKM